jgi:hypothetical protein
VLTGNAKPLGVGCERPPGRKAVFGLSDVERGVAACLPGSRIGAFEGQTSGSTRALTR